MGGGEGEGPIQPPTATAGGEAQAASPAAEDRSGSGDSAPPSQPPAADPASGSTQTQAERNSEGLTALKLSPSGHQLQAVGQFVFCRVCGAYASRGARRLRDECSGPLCPKESQRDAKMAKWRDRLLEARHPTSNAPL